MFSEREKRSEQERFNFFKSDWGILGTEGFEKHPKLIPNSLSYSSISSQVKQSVSEDKEPELTKGSKVFLTIDPKLLSEGNKCPFGISEKSLQNVCCLLGIIC